MDEMRQLSGKDLVAVVALFCITLLMMNGRNGLCEMMMLAIIGSYFGYPFIEKLKEKTPRG